MIRLLIRVSSLALACLADLSCSGCDDPLVGMTVWTDNSDVWKCEKMTRNFMNECRDTVEVECGRKVDLGGSLYIMTFPESPDSIGIKPDHVRKTKGSTVRVTMDCVDGNWRIRSRHQAQTHILCDQFIIEENRVGHTASSSSTTATESYFNDTTTYKEQTSTSIVSTETAAETSPATPLPYDFADITLPARRKSWKGQRKLLRKIRIRRPRQKAIFHKAFGMRDSETGNRAVHRRIYQKQRHPGIGGVPMINTPKYVPFHRTTEGYVAQYVDTKRTTQPYAVREGQKKQ